MALSKGQLAIVRAIKGKLQSLLLLKKKDAYTTDKTVDHTMHKINSLIVTNDLSGEEDLLYEIYDTLVKIKKPRLAWKFAKKHNLSGRINN